MRSSGNPLSTSNAVDAGTGRRKRSAPQDVCRPCRASRRAREAISILFSPPTATVAVGEQVDVVVLAGGARGLSAGELTITYDASAFRLFDVRPGAFLTIDGKPVDFTPTFNPGEVRIAFARQDDTTGLRGSGHLVLLSFQALTPGPARVISARGSLLDPNGASIPASFSSSTHRGPVMFRTRLRISVVLAVGGRSRSSSAGPCHSRRPAGASFTITANPTSIPAVGGTSTITIVMFKAAEDGGGTVADGTQIFLTTNLGVIEENASRPRSVSRAPHSKATAGRARRRSPRPRGLSLRTPSRWRSAPASISCSPPNPPTVSPPDFTTELVATVFDMRQQPLGSRTHHLHHVSAGALASQSTSLRTNASGQASDRLTLLNQASATVTVFSGQVASNTVTVNRGTVPGPVVASISPTSGQPGETLNVTIDGLNFQPGAVVSFGEGISVNSVRFVDSNQLVANITIDSDIQNTSSSRTVTVTNPDGSSGSLPSAFRIITPNPAPLITSLSPTQTSVRGATVTVFINGLNFQAGAQVTFSSSAGSVNILGTFFTSSTQMEVDITIDSVPIGPPAGTVFQVRVINPDGLQSNAADFTAN